MFTLQEKCDMDKIRLFRDSFATIAGLALAVSLGSCTKDSTPVRAQLPAEPSGFTLKDVAVMLSALPMESTHLDEVHTAVTSSSGNGYDEEYMMRDLLSDPGAGVGDDAATRAAVRSGFSNPLRNLIEDYLANNPSARKSASSKAGGPDDVQACIDALCSSKMQIYWPYSEDWDGETFPVITFDPGYGAESNYGYLLARGDDGLIVVDSVYVDENLAKSRPVWVVNSNDDSSMTPLELVMDDEAGTRSALPGASPRGASSKQRNLYLKNFTMLRNYDSWFAGASEFWVKCGSVKGFKATVESDLQHYTPSITDLVVVVKRKYLGVAVPFQAILVSDFTEQLDKLAFLITEDDGGKSTTWNCSATVKIKSKSYGFEMSIPYRQNDDIVWRGQLSAGYFTQDKEVSGRFGDVMVTFALE